MTMTAERPADTATPGDAAEILREMAAVVRTIFGAGIQSSRAATAPVAGQTESAAQPQDVAVPEPRAAAPAPAPTPAPATPTSIPLPSIPLPALPLDTTDDAPHDADTDTDAAANSDADPDLPTADAEPGRPAEVDESPAPYLGEIPTLRLVATTAQPADDVTADHRQAVLREVAFLDD